MNKEDLEKQEKEFADFLRFYYAEHFENDNSYFEAFNAAVEKFKSIELASVTLEKYVEIIQTFGNDGMYGFPEIRFNHLMITANNKEDKKEGDPPFIKYENVQKGIPVDETKANAYFKEKNIEELLRLIDTVFSKKEIETKLDALDELVNDPKYINFVGKRFLYKMAILKTTSDSCDEAFKFMLPLVYRPKDDEDSDKGEYIIKKIYKDFFPEEESEPEGKKNDGSKGYPIFSKSIKVMQRCYEILDIKERSPETQLNISKMLWEYSTGNIPGLSKDSPNIIYYGSPGTGKTYTVRKNLHGIVKTEKDERIEWVQCHPGFGYEEFIEGLKPVGFTESGIKLDIVNGAFKKLCIRARNECEAAAKDNREPKTYYFVADEINRANLSVMFGETLSLLEADYRDDPNGGRSLHTTPLSTLIEKYINEKLTSEWAGLPEDEQEKKINGIAYSCDIKEDGEVELKDKDSNAKRVKKYCVENVKFGVPHNIRFIGMMNDVDKSIDAFDLALRRRFKWIKMKFEVDDLQKILKNAQINETDITAFCKSCEKLNEFISKKGDNKLGLGEAYEFGHAYYMRIKAYLPKNVKIKPIEDKACEKLFDEHLEPVLTEYIRSFVEEDKLDSKVKDAKEYFTDTYHRERRYALVRLALGKIKMDSKVADAYIKCCRALNEIISQKSKDYELENDVLAKIVDYINQGFDKGRAELFKNVLWPAIEENNSKKKKIKDKEMNELKTKASGAFTKSIKKGEDSDEDQPADVTGAPVE